MVGRPNAAGKRRQRNYSLDAGLADDFDTFCSTHDFVRDRTAERAMRLFLDASSEESTQKFIAHVSDDTAAALAAFRELFLVDRSRLVDHAVRDYIDRQMQLRPEKKREFDDLKA